MGLYGQVEGSDQEMRWWWIRRRARHIKTEGELKAALTSGEVFWW